MKPVAAAVFLFATTLSAAETLRVTSAGPVGEVATLAEANEIRVVFSEPMVVVGRIPQPVTAPFFRIEPAVMGTFRWSGTTTLIFTPDSKSPLPFARQFTVTIDQSARSVAGNTLDRDYTFSFTTPAIRLVRTQWYRKGGDAAAPLVIGLRFNQPVNARTVAVHVQLRTVAHEFQQPSIPQSGKERLKAAGPQALEAFEAKRSRAASVAAAAGERVLAFVTNEWDRDRIPPGDDVVVLETKPGVSPEAWLQVYLDDRLAERENDARVDGPQEFTIQLEPMLFVHQLSCLTRCDPESGTFLEFRTQAGLRLDKVRAATTVTDITDPARPIALTAAARPSTYDYPSSGYSLDVLGYELQPSRRYLVRVDPSLQAEDGQTLGYTWMGVIDVWHKSAFISFGEGQGVWESSGGAILPFSARNFRSVKEWLAPLSIEATMPLLLELQRNGFRSTPPGAAPRTRTLNVVADKIQSFGLDVSSAIGPDNQGLLWAAIAPGQAIPRSRIYDPTTRATIVQVTNLGISVKDSPLNTLILVTALDSGAPVSGANVSIRTTDNQVFWTGQTGDDGVAMVTNTNLRTRWRNEPKKEGEDEYDESWRALGELHFIVVAEKEGDVAYVGSDWNEGITPWELGVDFDINESDPLLRGTIFSDRGVYKLGEEVHAKLIVRSDTPGRGMQLLPAGTRVEVALRDSQNKEILNETLALNDWSSAEWVFRVPAEAPLGNYSMQASIDGQRLEVGGGFLVAAYRRPDFRVDLTLDAPSTLAGTDLAGQITARYLSGGAMAGRDVKWTYTKRPVWNVPETIRNVWPADRFTFLGPNDEISADRVTISSKEEKLAANGELQLTLATNKTDGWPYEYRLEAEVTDVTRQRIANRTSFRTDPAAFYIGLGNPPYFAQAATGITTEVVVAGLDGEVVRGVPVQVSLDRIQFNSVRRAVGNGFYEWETERKEIPVRQWTITSTGHDTLAIDLPEGGQYRLTARGTDSEGRTTATRAWFYALGAGYTAWERYDHNRIDLIPEKQSYKPGQTARIMIKSPWETATALLTTEREGIRSHRRFHLSSTQETISVPITEHDIPNVFVSVLLVKGRTQEATTEDTSDPGKPSFRLGYVELQVEDASKRLTVDVKANGGEFRPAAKAAVEVTVRDGAGKPVRSEVTLWAVDYGVLSLTAYQTPDVLDSIYLQKALQVVNEDSRQRIISRRVLTPKGASQGGGGGADAGPGTLRKDFRVLAFWIGSVVTDGSGRARTSITLPESLTTYRIMAVAGDRASRFGWDQSEIRVNKPLMLTPAFPRFLSVGDSAQFGGVVHSQNARGRATVTMRSLDPSILELTGPTARTVEVTPGSAAEVRFGGTAHSAGTARIQMRVSMRRESDAFEDVIPVRVLVSPETVAAHGEAAPSARETLQLPAHVVPGFGGMQIDLASTQLVGLAEGARYLLEYPYGCAEQRASTTLGLMLVADVGGAFDLPGIDAGKSRLSVEQNLRSLEKFQCGDGGFAFWAGRCSDVSPYLTSYVLHVFQRAQKLGYRVDADMLRRGHEFLERSLNENRPPNEGWWPAFTSWQAFAVKTLAEGGRNVDSHLNRIHGYVDRMPLFGIAFLADAMQAAGKNEARLQALFARIRNSILPEGGFAHVEELADPNLLWFWSSNVRSTAIVIGTLARNGADEDLVKRMVRWLMRVREDGRWGNTQENAWAMTALVDYYRKYEADVPDFAATVALGAETIVREEFRGRSTDVKTHEFSMKDVLSKGKAGEQMPVAFQRDGAGTLFFMMRLRYASMDRNLTAMNNGFEVERAYHLNGQASGEGTHQFKAGDLIRVTLRVRNTKERRFVAVTDPIPAGTEPVETAFATTATALVDEQSRAGGDDDWMSWFRRGGWDHSERHDDRVNIFATRLGEGLHEFAYLLRATTAGTFFVAPAHVEEMYEPEVFGRTDSLTFHVNR